MKVKKISRRGKPYEGSDAITEWHREKTKSSISEAYKDADYATAIWRCETRFEHELKMVKAWAGIGLGIGLAYWVAFGVIDWLKGFPNG